MPDQRVPDTETISRYLFDGEIRSDSVIRHQAFIPSPTTLRHSVFRTARLSEAEIWRLAAEKVEPQRRLVVGRGDLIASSVYELKLNLEADADPSSKHADITGWPADRELRVTIAKDLARIASPAKRRVVT